MTGKRIRYLFPRSINQGKRRGTIVLAEGAAVRVVVRWDDKPDQPQWVETIKITWHGVDQNAPPELPTEPAQVSV